MGNLLETPRTEKDSHVYCSSTGLRIDHVFVAIFDGHAGSGGAKYAAEKIVSVLENTAEWALYLEGDASDISKLGEAMVSVFLKVDRDMRTHQAGTYGQDVSGCTAVSAIITPTHILCANAGDSRCVLRTADAAKALSFDHKPHHDVERMRIEAAGGFVHFNRVDGDVAVSRAFGDFGYKNRTDLRQEEQKISCAPDLTVHERTEADEILLVACDGLWDVFSNTEAVAQLNELLQCGERDAVQIAEEMVDLSLEKGSKDNISAVVVVLPGAKFGSESGGGVRKRRERRSLTASAQAALPEDQHKEGPGPDASSDDKTDSNGRGGNM